MKTQRVVAATWLAVRGDGVLAVPPRGVQLIWFVGPGSGERVPNSVEIVEVARLEPERWHLFAPAVCLALANLRLAPRRPDERSAPG